jgi:hypothetical protein
MLEKPLKRFGEGAAMRIGTTAIVVALGGSLLLPASCANAQDTSFPTRLAQAAPQDGPPPARRPPTRLRVHPNYYQQQDVYPHYNPGPNAVRVCNATYVQEYRPSGTVIVPRMSCYWTRG